MVQSAVDQQAGGSGSLEPTSSAIWTPSVVSSATTAPSVVPPAVSTVRELDAPASICYARIWCASTSTSEALLATSISRRSFFLARASSSDRPLRLLALSLGEDGGMFGVGNRAANTVSSAGSTDSGIQKSGHLCLQFLDSGKRGRCR